MPPLTETTPAEPPNRFAPVITGVLLALPGICVGVHAMGFKPHDALDAMIFVAYWGAAGATLAAVPTGVYLASIPKHPAVGVVVGLVGGVIAGGLGFALVVGGFFGNL